MQRKRDFSAYEDLEAHYERRPSLWVEPIGDWGEGEVAAASRSRPSDEIHDNIVAFWRPQAAAAAPRASTTSPTACTGPIRRHRSAWPVRADAASAPRGDTRLFVLDVAGETLEGARPADAEAASRGQRRQGQDRRTWSRSRTRRPGGWRLSFELAPEDKTLVELRAQLDAGDTPLSETWLYRWTP